MAQGSNEYSMLEDGRSKLLLAQVPPGSGRGILGWPSASRFGRSAALRIYFGERRNTSWSIAGQPRGSSTAARMTPGTRQSHGHHGPFVSSMLSSEEREDLSWATSGCAGLQRPATGASPRPFRGFSGTRVEHITDLLNVPRRVHANKIHASWISAGTRRPPDGSRARSCAGSVRRMASRDPPRW